MVSTNHFRGRRLSRNLRAPVTPRHLPLNARSIAPKPDGLYFIGSMDVTTTIGMQHIALDTYVFVNVGSPIYEVYGSTHEGASFRIQVVEYEGPDLIYGELAIDLGSGYANQAGNAFPEFDGSTPYFTPPEEWDLIDALAIVVNGGFQIWGPYPTP